MTDEEPVAPPQQEDGATADSRPTAGSLRDLAELEAEIRRRLRSNQLFLERFLDEDFVDDEADSDEEPESDGEEL